MNIKDLVPGSILSETSFFTVKKIQSDIVTVVDDYDNEIEIGKEYVEKILSSADIYDKEEKKTMTELADIFINSPRIAMTVAFYKKDIEKTNKAYEAEKKAIIQKIVDAKVSDIPALLNELIENPLSKVVPGKLRIMKGRHYSNIDELGRIQFIDMEIAKEPNKDYDSRIRQVDPRTIQYLIVGGIKYLLK